MRRKSVKSARSKSDSSFESDLRLDSLPLVSNEKHQWRKCQCCRYKRNHDYLRDQRESRERASYLKKRKEVEKEERNRSQGEINGALTAENWNPNLKKERLKGREMEEYLLMEKGRLEKVEDRVIDQQFSCDQILSTPQNSSGKNNQGSNIPHHRQKLTLLKSQLSSILEAENSTSLVNQFNRVSSIHPPLKLSISVHTYSDTHTKTWTDKHQIQHCLDQLTRILY